MSESQRLTWKMLMKKLQIQWIVCVCRCNRGEVKLSMHGLVLVKAWLQS